MLCAFAMSMKAKNLDDVLVYRKAVTAADEVSAILKRPIFRKDFGLIICNAATGKREGSRRNPRLATSDCRLATVDYR